jgi:DNA-binding Xre family transcriptional regulator
MDHCAEKGVQNMAQGISSNAVRSALKLVLKRRNMSYNSLARELGVSLSTIKRILTTEDISLERLFELCEVLACPPEEIIGLARESESSEVRFSDEEDEFLARNPSLFRYHSLLLAGKTPAQISLRFRLEQKETSFYLNELERAGLLRRTSRGLVRLKYAGRNPQWAAHGKLQQIYLHRVLSRVVDHFSARFREFEKLRPSEKPPLSLSLAIKRMRPATLARFAEEAKQLFQRCRMTAELEERLEGEAETVPVVFGFLGDLHNSIEAWNEEVWPSLHRNLTPHHRSTRLTNIGTLP